MFRALWPIRALGPQALCARCAEGSLGGFGGPAYTVGVLVEVGAEECFFL